MANKPETTVYVVDDDEGTRKSLQMLLEVEGFRVEAFSSGSAFLQDVSTFGAQGCILLDLNLGDMSGLQLHAELNRMGCHLPIIYVTGYGSIPQAVKAIHQGAADFLTKPFNPDALLALLHQVIGQPMAAQMDAPAGHRLSGQTPMNTDGNDRFVTLTPREREILKRVLAGQTNKLIARDLGISFRTVELHRSHILQKTGVSNMMELAHMAFKATFAHPNAESPWSQPALAQVN